MSLLTAAMQPYIAPGEQFEVVEEIIHGIRQRTYKNRVPEMRSVIEVALGHGDREHLVQGDIRLGFDGAFGRSLSVARTLHDEFGVRPGDRVGVLGANAPDWVVCYWAALALDAVVVPFNAWWQKAELAYGLEDSGTTFLFADPRRADVAAAAGFDRGRVAAWGPGADDAAAGTTVERMAEAERAPLDLVPHRGEDETAAILYTSGTTGRPKGSANTTRNIISNLCNVALASTAINDVLAADRTPDDEQLIDLCVVPLFHATANFSYVVPFAYAGHKLVFMPPGRFDIEDAAAMVERERVTRIGGVPTIVARFIQAGVAERYDLSSLTGASYGGAPASPALMANIERAFPNLRHRVVQGYGLTETSAISTLNMGPDHSTHPGSAGVAMPIVEMRICDPDGVELPTGEVGEVLLRGANVIPGYWNRPDANANTFVDGFLRTGDVGYVDEDGFLTITDRAKDMVIRGGENVASAEVEGVLDGCPGVAESAVIGVPDPDLGERVKAVVVVIGDTTVEDIEAFARQNMASFKVPEVWELRTEPLPRNPSGKILKRALRGDAGGVFAVGADSDSAL